MRQLLLVSFYWLIFSSASFAQPAYDTGALTKSVNPFYLKLNPFALLEFDGGIGISGEYVWTKRKLGFQVEVQPVLFSYDGVLEDADGTAGFESPENTIESAMPVGFKLRPEIRYDRIVAGAAAYNNSTNYGGNMNGSRGQFTFGGDVVIGF